MGAAEPRVVHHGAYVRGMWPKPYTYVGRPTKWGNPFVIPRDGDRETVICKYREHLAEHPELVAMAREELRGRNLGCWCAPQTCHADILLEIANG